MNDPLAELMLARGFLLGQAVERWHTRAIWVISRADGEYPKRLKARLKDDSPALLYGCGDAGILNTGGLAVVGSRDVDDVLVGYAEGIGRLAAKASRTLVSGGARGIDQAAMRGALEVGGKVVGVTAHGRARSSSSTSCASFRCTSGPTARQAKGWKLYADEARWRGRIQLRLRSLSRC